MSEFNREPSDVRASSKRGYVKPQLVAYGNVRALTTGGSGATTENKGKDPQLDKKP